MTIHSADIHWYASQHISDTTPSQNGGRLSNTEQVSNVKGNVWPDVPQSERIAGSSKMRKCFIKIHSAPANPAAQMLNAFIFVDQPSPGNDYTMLLYDGSVTNTQDTFLAGTPRYYGAGTLHASASQGATTLVVDMDNAAMGGSSIQPFKPGDTIWVSNQANINASGNSEFLTIASGDVSWSGGTATITLVSGTTFAWTVGSTPIIVASCIPVASVQPTVTTPTVTGSAGMYIGGNAGSGGNITLNGTGAIDQNWTIIITNNATGAFRLDGDTLGTNVATGAIGTNFSPMNAAFSTPYFNLASVGWGGTWANGDTFAFSTTSATAAYWENRIIPPGANSIANTGSRIAISGESA